MRFWVFRAPAETETQHQNNKSRSRAPVCRCRGQTIWVLHDDVWLDRTSAIRQPQRLDWGHFGIYIFVIEWMEMKWSAFLDYYYDGRLACCVDSSFEFMQRHEDRPEEAESAWIESFIWLFCFRYYVVGSREWKAMGGTGFTLIAAAMLLDLASCSY